MPLTCLSNIPVVCSITDRIIIPFKVICNIKSETRTRLEMELVLKSLVEERMFAINIQVIIPVPPNAADATYVIDPRASNMRGHKVKFKPTENVIVWKMKRMQVSCARTCRGMRASPCLCHCILHAHISCTIVRGVTYCPRGDGYICP